MKLPRTWLSTVNLLLVFLLLKVFSDMCSKISSSWDTTPSAPLYIITPTYPRWTQLPDLVRLGQTLKHLDNVFWLVSEDSSYENPLVIELLDSIGVPYKYILGPMPAKYRSMKEAPRGVSNRNQALLWIYDHADENGVFYFADDDNSYQLPLFEEIRKTRRVSAFPAGLVGHFYASAPIVNHKGKITEFLSWWKGKRIFQLDMAQFAVNVGFYKEKSGEKAILMPFHLYFEEDHFLKGLNISLDQLEPLMDDCTKVYVWHTQTKAKTDNFVSGIRPTETKSFNLLALSKLQRSLKDAINHRYE